MHMDSETLYVAMFFIFILGAGFGFQAARLLF